MQSRLHLVSLLTLGSLLCAETKGYAQVAPSATAPPSVASAPKVDIDRADSIHASLLFAPVLGFDAVADGHGVASDRPVGVGGAVGYRHRLGDFFSLGAGVDYLQSSGPHIARQLAFPVLASLRLLHGDVGDLSLGVTGAYLTSWFDSSMVTVPGESLRAHGLAVEAHVEGGLRVSRDVALSLQSGLSASVSAFENGASYAAGKSVFSYAVPVRVGVRYAF